MIGNKLQIYRASAGSGKTYKLTEKFLLLAFRKPDYFRRVLAVTFTNKAAEEMKNRILEELNLLATAPQKADHQKTLEEYFSDWTPGNIQERAQKIRDNILHQYSKFSVSTIDSFVQRILRSFAYEIGAQTGYQVEMDMERVIQELTDRMEDQVKEDAQLLEWLIRFATFRADNGQGWNFRRQVSELATIIFTEQFQQISRHQNALPDKQTLKDIETQLRKIRYSFEKSMKRKAADMLQHVEAKGMRTGDYGAPVKTLRNYLFLVQGGNKPGDFLPNKTVIQLAEGEKNWCTQNMAKNANSNPEIHKKVARIEALKAELTPLLKDLLEFYEKHETDYVTAAAILENLYTYGILNDLAALLPQYREAHNSLLISDANVLLRNIVQQNDAPFIYEKTGNTYHHLLIDEFQDTSHFQWENFRPLADNSLAYGNYNLIVGDVKQSIYRWRGGDWRLLLSQVQQDLKPDRIEETPLEHNFRSHENIIRLNNTLFHHAPKVLQKRYNNQIEEELREHARNNLLESGLTEIFTLAYADSYQKPGKPDKTGGKVDIRFFEKKKLQENVEQELPYKIDSLIRDSGYAPGEIGILVRTNAESTQIRDLLMHHQQNHEDSASYAVVSPESLTLRSSPGIRLIIAAMQYLNNREAVIPLANVMLLHQRLQGRQEATHDLFAKAAAGTIPEGALPEGFVAHADELASLSIYEMTERLIRLFGLEHATHDQPYLSAFLDFALKFSRNDSADLAAFLEWWEETGKRQSVELPETRDAVRILTIHKSKGLAFDVVVLPYVTWKMDHQQNPQIWCNPDTPPFDSLPPVLVKYKKGMEASHFYKEYFTEKAYAAMDALNNLYVAMTRPRAELHIIAAFSGKQSNSYTAGDLLYELMAFEAPDTNGYYLQCSKWFDKAADSLLIEAQPVLEEKDTDTAYSGFSLKHKVSDWRSRLSIKQHAKEFFVEAVESIREKVDYGTVMHEIMARIQQPEDVNPAVQAAFFEGKIALEDTPAIKAKIQGYIDYPEARDWFYGDWEIHNELPILTGDGEQRIADRVLEGQEQVLVIDYKFGNPQEEYRSQIAEYMELLREIFELPVAGYLYYPDQPLIEEIQP